MEESSRGRAAVADLRGRIVPRPYWSGAGRISFPARRGMVEGRPRRRSLRRTLTVGERPGRDPAPVPPASRLLRERRRCVGALASQPGQGARDVEPAVAEVAVGAGRAEIGGSGAQGVLDFGDGGLWAGLEQQGGGAGGEAGGEGGAAGPPVGGGADRKGRHQVLGRGGERGEDRAAAGARAAARAGERQAGGTEAADRQGGAAAREEIGVVGRRAVGARLRAVVARREDRQDLRRPPGVHDRLERAVAPRLRKEPGGEQDVRPAPAQHPVGALCHQDVVVAAGGQAGAGDPARPGGDAERDAGGVAAHGAGENAGAVAGAVVAGHGAALGRIEPGIGAAAKAGRHLLVESARPGIDGADHYAGAVEPAAPSLGRADRRDPPGSPLGWRWARLRAGILEESQNRHVALHLRVESDHLRPPGQGLDPSRGRDHQDLVDGREPLPGADEAAAPGLFEKGQEPHLAPGRGPLQLHHHPRPALPLGQSLPLQAPPEDSEVDPRPQVHQDLDSAVRGNSKRRRERNRRRRARPRQAGTGNHQNGDQEEATGGADGASSHAEEARSWRQGRRASRPTPIDFERPPERATTSGARKLKDGPVGRGGPLARPGRHRHPYWSRFWMA
jgi:hypothetical protein